MPDSPFRAQARWQAGWCRALGSPFTAAICDIIADRLPSGSALARRLDQWPGNIHDDALILRVTGALHGRVRSGKAPGLAAVYPPAPIPDADRLWAALEPELTLPQIAPWLELPPQTNEVARSGTLMPGFLVIAAETGLPLALFELGCSGGLNLLPDRYAYRLGTLDAGDPDSLLLLEPEWIGPNPPDAPISIFSRLGVDLNPPDLSSPEQRARMLAYVWADQTERLERMAQAMVIAAEDMPEIVTGDAAEFVEAHVKPCDGVVTTVFHSIAMQYFPETTKARIISHMHRMGAQATRDAPLAWLRLEQENPGAGEPPTLRLTLWPGGEDRLLARAHPHGRIVSWL
ncbi:DUF2332 domain-containing protein [Sandaracinobacter neustonicus]|uniref:DUF2332 domain-containing protein n=1 Tax=Sandaracinobacter neustonicus TaxID=1715348 RepID=A0A501XFW1_9SPHN|nr:DUF2332 domain-containing protein [Sandaracinobacter neustonicus]TPE59426.1 DUF2332 domain-containing protein [Sandaracinobacter neustonicus]